MLLASWWADSCIRQPHDLRQGFAPAPGIHAPRAPRPKANAPARDRPDQILIRSMHLQHGSQVRALRPAQHEVELGSTGCALDWEDWFFVKVLLQKKFWPVLGMQS